jgi:energy-coupling factor transporter ATP-binding protein EcfA2
MAKRAILLDGGEIVKIGSPRDVIRSFVKEQPDEEHTSREEFGRNVLSARDVSKRYFSVDRGVVRAVNAVTFDVARNEIFGIIGKSGAGKTTLSRMIAGIIGQVHKILADEPKANMILARVFTKHPGLGKFADRYKLKPAAVAGYPMYRGVARLLGILLESRVSILEALSLTRQSIGGRYSALVARTEEAVAHGQPMSEAFSQSDLISPSVCEAIRSGEQSGQVGALLLNIADFLDEENEIVIRSLASIIEPVILILMGVLVAVVAISMFMPLFDLTAIAQRGAP